MNVTVYAEWLRRRGQKVVATYSTHWHSEGFGVFQAFPYHRMIQPSEEELRELMTDHGATVLRFSMPVGSSELSDDYHVVYTGVEYDLGTLGTWARKNVRRGLRNCEVGMVSFERYVQEGWALRTDTLARQGRHVNETRDQWERQYSCASDLPGFEVWAAEVRGRLAATLVTFRMDDWCYMVYQQCHRDYLPDHVNNALTFVVTRNMIKVAKLKGVFYGMRSLDAPKSVDEFKLRMGFEARPIRQRVIFHPRLRPFINRATHRMVKSLSAILPRNRPLSKAEGLIRSHLASRNTHVADRAEVGANS